jgi:hypothetical protein
VATNFICYSNSLRQALGWQDFTSRRGCLASWALGIMLDKAMQKMLERKNCSGKFYEVSPGSTVKEFE